MCNIWPTTIWFLTKATHYKSCHHTYKWHFNGLRGDKYSLAVFCDLLEEFHTMKFWNHEILLLKLSNYGIGGNALKSLLAILNTANFMYTMVMTGPHITNISLFEYSIKNRWHSNKQSINIQNRPLKFTKLGYKAINISVFIMHRQIIIVDSS